MDVIRILVEQVALDVNVQRSVRDTQRSSYASHDDFGRIVEGESILHVLVRGEHWWHASEGLPYFLEHGANVNIRNVLGETPLNALLNRCGWLLFDKRMVGLLVKYGADVNSVDVSGRSCLAKACSDIETARLLVDCGANVTSDVFEQAFRSNNVDLLELLLSRGADPNVRKSPPDPQPAGYTEVMHSNRYPLHYLLSMRVHQLRTDSERMNYKCMLEMMLKHGADPCAAYDNTTVLHELIKENIDVNPFFSTPNATLNLECRDSVGRTPLLVTSLQTSSPDRTEQNNPEGRNIFNLLVSRGADTLVRDFQGNNVLHFFVENSYYRKFTDYEPIVRRTPELINQPNAEGNTPLHLAMKNVVFSQCIDFMLANGGDINVTDKSGNSLLHLLMAGQWTVNDKGNLTGKSLNIFNHLLSKGMDLNARNHTGETPVFSFLRTGIVSFDNYNNKFEGSLDQLVFDLFTKHGADWLALNAQGQNLLHIVASTNSVISSKHRRSNPVREQACARFKALLEFGLDAGLEDEAGRTPLDCAADVGLQEILELFQKK